MKTALALALILLIISAAPACIVMGETDPLQDYYDKYEPTMMPPSILITSPQNHSIINTNSISLVFNVSEPQIIEVSPDVNHHSSRLFRVSYMGDWQTEEQLLYLAQQENLDFLEFNITLSEIPDGTHELQIIAVGAVGITVAMFGFSYHPDANTSIIFTVSSMQPTSFPEPTPYKEPQPIEQEVILGITITLAVIGVGLGLLYLTKRK